MTRNRLANEPSPYLVQHKDNPVHWYPWGDEPFEIAKQTKKPVLLSIGYAACHWCHVMAHESFEDQETADLMNQLFVNIKLDREERPDIDKIYMEALHHLGEQGGWPLNVFLNADRKPFWGGTYFPKTPQYGRPSFKQVLQQISDIYQNAPEKVKTNCDALQKALNRRSKTAPAFSMDMPMTLIDKVAEQIQTIVDPVHGGLQGAPKFPQVPIFQLLWRHHIRTGDEKSYQLVMTTLINICQGGIYDHLIGGFARYSVDDRWLVPHFEKMLYDNAQLIDILTLAWQQTDSDLFRDRIEGTISWATAEMIVEHNAFASSLDADSEGVEGKFYVWQQHEIENLLGDPAKTFCEIYDVSSHGNWEHTNILNRLFHPEVKSEQIEQSLKESRAILLKERARRIRPGIDDKILTDWNGLMIAAIANAGFVFDRNDWTDVAKAAYAGVRSALWDGHRLQQSHRNGETRYHVTADGYANMIRAALALHETTQNPNYLEDAQTWTDCLNEDFNNSDEGGFFFTSASATDLIRRTLTAADDATPNANATMLANLSRLYGLSGNNTYKDLVDSTLRAFTAEVQASGIAHAGFLNGFEDFLALTQIVLVGDQNSEEASKLLSAIRKQPIASRQLQIIENPSTLSDEHPAKNKPATGPATLYICKGQTCSLPITEPEKVETALRLLF